MSDGKRSSLEKPELPQSLSARGHPGISRQELTARGREPRNVLVPEDAAAGSQPDPGDQRDVYGAGGVGAPLRVLVVEDSPEDGDLLLHDLRRAGYDPTYLRVDTAGALREALDRQEWDIVFSDHAMPRFSAPEALAIVKEKKLDLPFIIVSGTIGEETAVEAMRAGADDYLMKGRLARLVPAMERGLQNAAERRALRRAEEAVRRRDAILRAVVGAAEKLLRSKDWEQSIQEVLAGLGRAMDVSRIYVLENVGGENGAPLTLRHEWVAPGIPAAIAEKARHRFSVPGAGLGRWAAVLSRGETFYAHASDLPAPERELASACGIRSFACVPIFVGQKWWGLIGFDELSSEREWSSAELDAVKTAADTLGAAIQRHQMEQHSERQVRRLAGVHAINLATTASLDLGVTLNVFLDQVTSQLGVDAADVLRYRPDSQVLEYLAGRGFRTASLQHTKLPLGQGFAGRAALQRRSVSVPDLRREPGSLARASSVAGEGFIAYYGIPLIARARVMGVLELFHRAPLELAPEWLEFAHTLAGQAAVAIDHALMYEDLQSSALKIMETPGSRHPEVRS